MTAPTVALNFSYGSGPSEALCAMLAAAALPNSVVIKAETVVNQALKALRNNQTVLVPGLQAKAVAWTSKIMPRRLMAQITARVMRR